MGDLIRIYFYLAVLAKKVKFIAKIVTPTAALAICTAAARRLYDVSSAFFWFYPDWLDGTQSALTNY